MSKRNKNCQSCGMPLSKDPEKGGLESNGTKSLLYCSYCYVDGQFINPEMTMDEMKVLVKGKMKEMGFPGFIAGFFTKGIPKLKRWNI